MTVDLTASMLRQSRLTRAEAERIAAAARRRALDLFPGKADTFDLIIAPRFRRILDERFGPSRQTPPSGPVRPESPTAS